MSTLRLAPVGGKPVVLRGGRNARTVFPRMPYRLEYVHDARAMPWLRASVDLDLVSAVRGMVAARGLVRRTKRPGLKAGFLEYADRAVWLRGLSNSTHAGSCCGRS